MDSTVKSLFTVHPTADVQTRAIGQGTRIWQFCVVLAGAKIGRDCNICSHCLIESDVSIGDRVTVKSGVHLWDGIAVGDDAFIGPNVAFTNDPYPRSKHRLPVYPRTLIEAGASLGANCTILPGVTIGRGSLVAAGAVVTRNVPPHALVKGNPGRIHGYSDAIDLGASTWQRHYKTTKSSSVAGVAMLDLPGFQDLRGDLLALELEKNVSFKVRRIFFITNVPSQHVRGEHAHRTCEQLLVCVHGAVKVMVDNGAQRASYTLDSPFTGLHIAPMVWASQFGYTSNAVLAVLASHPYDNADYLRSYEDYLDARRAAVTHGLPKIK